MLVWILIVAAAACLLYYGVIVVCAGFGASFASIWLLAGGFFAVAAAGVRYYQRYPEKMQLWVPVSFVTLCGLGFIVLVITQILILGQIPATAEPNLDYVIVLGAQVKPEGPSKTLKLRLDKAVEYAVQNPNTILVLSGGQGNDEPSTEAAAMRNYLLEQGILERQLLLEENSRSTLENIVYSHLVIEERQKQKVFAERNTPVRIGILTNNFHLYRAKLIAKHYGLEDVSGIAAESDKILFIHFCLRDGIALLKDRLMGNL